MSNSVDELKKTITVVVIIPTLNEEKGVGEVIDALQKALNGYNFEIVISDGRSKDRTVEIAKQHNAKVIFQKRIGYGDALLSGYLYSIEELNADILVNLDADGTYEPSDISKMLDEIILNRADYVVGKRKVSLKNMKISHIIGNRMISFLIRHLLGVKVSDTQCGLFAFRSYLIKNVDDWATEGWALNTELLTKAAEYGMIIKEMETEYHPRQGTAHNTAIGGGMANLSVLLRMVRDSKPLLLMGTIGSVIMVIGIAVGSLLVYDYLNLGEIYRPHTAVLAGVLIITGIQILTLGLVADMIKRIRQKRIGPKNSYYTKF